MKKQIQKTIKESLGKKQVKESQAVSVTDIAVGNEYIMKTDDDEKVRVFVSDIDYADPSDSVAREMKDPRKVEYTYLDNSYGMKGDTDTAIVDSNEKAFMKS